MKKTLVTTFLTLAIAALLMLMCANKIVFAEAVSENECDRIFYETVNQLTADTDGEIITADKALLYDIDLKPAAMLYDFRVGAKKGFCVIGNDEGKYVPFEIYPEAESPYADAIGLPIYLAQTTYADYRDDGLYYIEGIGVTKETILNAADVYYGVDYGFETTTSNVTYVSKTWNEYSNAKRIPAYIENNGTNVCAPVAAANIVAYFDRYAPELIPNYTPGNAMGQNYLYKVQSDTINQLIGTLYQDMGTTNLGATSDQFKEGLNSFCTRQGYSVSYENILSEGALNYSSAQSALLSKKALALFETKFSISTIADHGGNAEYKTMEGVANHVMAAFGYREITYQFSNGSDSTERYLIVATGMKDMVNAYLNVDKYLSLNEAYAINIA